MARREPQKKADGAPKRAGGAGVERGPGARILVFHGPEAFLQDEYLRQVKEELAATLGSDGVEVSRFDGANAEIADVLDECRSFDLMQRHKLVVVDAADKLVAGDNRAIMERYAAAPSPMATLALRCGKWNKGPKLDKAIEAVGAFMKCEPPSVATAVGWAMKRAEKRHAATLARETAQALVARVGPDLGRLDTEIAKLVSGIDPGGAITPEHVAELTGRGGEEEIWVVQDALAGGDPEKALATVRDAVTLWRQTPVGALFAEVDLVRKAHAYAAMVEGGEPPQAASKRARLWGGSAYSVPAFVGRAGGAAALADLLHWAVRLDARSKGEGLSEAARSVETLALRIAMLGSARRR